MDIPKDFDSKWELSDVVLIAEDTEGNEKELHASKNYLAIYSTVFKTMFFSSFAEANSKSVKVSCDYETLKRILQIIYGQSRNFYAVNEQLELGVLPKLYKAADYFDIPAIRMMCIHQMKSNPSVEMATSVISVASVGDGLHDVLMEILEKLSPVDIKTFLSAEDSQLLLSKKDVKCIYQFITKKELLKPTKTYATWITERKISDLSKYYKNSRIDCTQKWPRSDIVLKTKNSDEKELYSNKTVLAMVSSHFSALFFGSPDSNHTEIEVDVDYMIMKNILTLVHQSFDIYNLPIGPFTLYSMYCAASKDNMDIPMIRSICINRLITPADDCDLELALYMKSEMYERQFILKNMIAENIRCWLFDFSDIVFPDYFSILNETEYDIAFTSEKKSVVSTTEVGIMIKKLLAEYNKSL